MRRIPVLSAHATFRRILPPAINTEPSMSSDSSSTGAAPGLLLRTGQRLPVVGLGTWKSKKGEVGKAIRAAIQAGYRHIDCASNYLNEDEIGDTLHEASGQLCAQCLLLS